MPGNFAPFEAKMRADGLSDAAVAAFKNAYDALTSGATGMIPESELTPASGVPKLVDVQAPEADAQLLAKTVVLKLNGGLGTSMGLDYAKSLLKVKGADTFLDLTAKQIMQMREDLQTNVKFVLMNSFATSQDTMAFFKEKYPALYADPNLEFVQNKVPKIRRDTFEPALWPTKPSVEWCPPGHGDLYAALLGSGTLDSMLAQGSKYLFVSNSDNLGATLDPKLLSYFAQSQAPFMMEVCERTSNDKKGGHLASRAGQLILREAAQCPDDDEDAFQDISKHRYFNTNNLWIDLEVRSRRFEVLRCLHFLRWTRVHLTSMRVVSLSISRPFGPLPVNTTLRAGATPRRRRSRPRPRRRRRRRLVVPSGASSSRHLLKKDSRD